MIKKILLVHPPYLSQLRSMPLGLAYLKAFIEKEGYDVSMIDMDPMGMDYDDFRAAVGSFMPDIVGISFMTLQANNAKKIAAIVKKYSEKIVTIAGGVHVSALPVETLKCGNFDFAVCGEGEETFKELLTFLARRMKNLNEVKGLAFKKENNIVINRPRKLIDNINLLPFPDWSGLPIGQYTDLVLEAENSDPVFPILATRGCPFDCIFCASKIIFGRQCRARSAENVLDEIKYLIRKYGAKNFGFVDDTLTLEKKRMEELCDLIIKSGFKISWKCNARVNGFDEQMASKLKRAGCKNVGFGVESGDPDVWQAVNKNILQKDVVSAHKAAKKAGLLVSSFFMVGNVGESPESIKKTIDFIKKIDTDYPTCAIATPYPGTKMYEMGKRKGWIKNENWDDYITTPHLKMGYKPFWSNGIMEAEEILNAYYYINSRIVAKKLIAHYGRLYFLRPEFYKKEILKRLKDKGIAGILKLIYRLFRPKRKNNIPARHKHNG